jgi:CheY-like chemotaxis protein
LLRPNLLVIDDDRQIREMLHQLFEKEGYNVHAATGGNEGLQWMRQQTPEVVLLDLGMPELDGPATLKQIRKDWGNLPVIVYTADAESDLVKRALEFSPFILLAKPCPPAQLLETVRKLHLAGDPATRNQNRLRVETPREKNRRCFWAGGR